MCHGTAFHVPILATLLIALNAAPAHAYANAFLHTQSSGSRGITWQSATYGRAATRQLVQAIRASAPGHVKVIWFNDRPDR